MDDIVLDATPDPGVAPRLPDRRVAFTDLHRGDTLASDGAVSVHGVRVDGVAAALAVVDRRDGLSGRELAEGVATWRSVADLEGVAGVLSAGKKPQPWVVAERPPLTLGSTPAGTSVPVDVDHALWVGTRLAGTVAAAHDRGVTHGALTPRTVRTWPTPDPETWGLTRVVDWGVGTARTATDGGVGVVGVDGAAVPPDDELLAPETRAGGDSPPATDIYGVGALVYWLLTGETPGEQRGGQSRRGGGESPVPPSTHVPALPGAVDDPLLDALAPDPEDRPGAAALRESLLDCLRTETGAGESDANRSDSRGSGASTNLPSAFPLFDGARAEWRAPCPDCGRSVNNTVASFVDHWTDATQCDGPPVDPPQALDGLTDREYARVVDAVERRKVGDEDATTGLGDHPLLAALADKRRTVDSVGGINVQRSDGEFPWLDQPRRGWRVPCPDCDEPVFNALSAFRSHWADAADCDGPPDRFGVR